MCKTSRHRLIRLNIRKYTQNGKQKVQVHGNKTKVNSISCAEYNKTRMRGSDEKYTDNNKKF